MGGRRWAVLLISIYFAAILVGCGSGGNTVGTYTPGKVGILLKDSPQDVPGPPAVTTPEMSQIWVTINKVSLKIEEDGGLSGFEGTTGADGERWLTVFEGTARYDLLALQDNKAALMALVSVPQDMAGYYSKARLELDGTPGQNCFYFYRDGYEMADGPSNPCTDSGAYQLIVPESQIDREFQSQIYLGQGSTQYMVFDFLPTDSIACEDADGKRQCLLQPVIYAYTMPVLIETNGWQNLNIEGIEGIVKEVSGCDDPYKTDTLIISHNYGSIDITVDITDAIVSFVDSDVPASCSSLHAGQEIEVDVYISSDGEMMAGQVKIAASISSSFSSLLQRNGRIDDSSQGFPQETF